MRCAAGGVVFVGKQENLTEEWGIDKAIQSEEFWVQVAKNVLKSAQTKCGCFCLRGCTAGPQPTKRDLEFFMNSAPKLCSNMVKSNRICTYNTNKT